MSNVDLGSAIDPPSTSGLRQRFLRLAASPGFQKWAARFPLTRGITRREGEEMFDLVAGFVHTQCLAALVGFGTLDLLMTCPQTLRRLANAAGVPEERMRVLLNAGAALGLMTRAGDTYSLTRRGAALTGVPGLADMIEHHSVLYRDLSDPIAFFRGQTQPELAHFWPYVFGAGAARDPDTAARYSRLMAETQTLVADETLASVSFSGHSQLMDVGGGTGAFLAAALQATPGLQGTLFDLPGVVPPARERFGKAGLTERTKICQGSFRDDPLPIGADVISLVRVLYDHADDTVKALLASVFRALPEGGTVMISEPMAGERQPTRAGDGYFAIYTMAMETGRTRSPSQIIQLLEQAGFVGVRHRPTHRPFITSVVLAQKP
ncbi:methyltransferase [Silicimonas sp. MF1-12-2]|uniref:methyltransferase n=1 Tax=Silicimonas sp. MF1-12-2 TaxID=3384793 RepID=UPI0039B646B4